MKVAAIAIAAASLIAAGTATASPARVTDVDYLRASRCRGLAEGLSADTANVDAFLKGAKKARDQYIVERGEAEMKRAKRETQGDRRDKASAEFSSACTAYVAGASDVAAR